MFQFGYFLLIGFVVSLLFLNLFFRVKVLKLYRHLVNNRIQFEAKHMLDQSRLESEIIPQYPEHADQIREFVRKVRLSITIASLIFICIVSMGLLMKYYF